MTGKMPTVTGNRKTAGNRYHQFGATSVPRRQPIPAAGVSGPRQWALWCRRFPWRLPPLRLRRGRAVGPAAFLWTDRRRHRSPCPFLVRFQTIFRLLPGTPALA